MLELQDQGATTPPEVCNYEAVVPHPLRQPCKFCAGTIGRVVERSGQDCVYCDGCDRWQYNAPRTETGRAVRTVSTVHESVRPSVRFRVLQRARGHCEMPGCGSTANLHLAHLLSVKDGLELGLTDDQLNSERNLAAFCAECNLGQGAAPMDPLIYLALLKKWLTP